MLVTLLAWGQWKIMGRIQHNPGSRVSSMPPPGLGRIRVGVLGLYEPKINAHIWVKIGECMLFGIDGFIIYQNHKKSFWN